MKSANPNPARNVVSSREMLALATFASVAHAAPEPQPQAAPESGERKKNQGDVLSDLVVSADQERTYNPERLSSNKLPAPLLDTPQTFSVIPKEVYNQQSARNLTDVLKNTPGISFNAGENGFGSGLSNFSMRGVDSVGSVFIDGVRDSGNYMRDVFNTERVEVAKGPAADNGRGTAGGYVNIVTKTPQLTDFFAGTTSYAFDKYAGAGNFRGTFDFNQSVENSPLQGTAIRLNALFQEGGVPGRRWAENNAWGVAPSITIGLGTPTRFTLAYQHLEQNLIPDWGVPGAMVKGTVNYHGSLSDSHRLRDNFYGLKSDYDDVVSDAILARVEHDFANGLKFTNQTRWSETRREAQYTVPTGYNAGTGMVTRQGQGYDRDNTSLSNLTNFTYEFQTGSLKHSLAGGLELYHEKSKADRILASNSPLSSTPPPNTPAYDPVPDFPAANLGAAGDSRVTIDSAAIYLYDTIEFNDRWQLTGGLRVEHYDMELKNRDTISPTPVPSYSTDDTTIGGKLGVVFKPAENGSIYASVGVSALPPGSFLSNPDISRDGNNAFPGAGAGMNGKNSKTQENWNYEIGTKWDFCDGRLSTTAALFRTERKNVAITGTPHIGGVAIPGAALDTGYHEQIIQGVELGVAGQLTEEWSIFGGLLIMESERKVSSYWETARRLANAGDYNAAYNSFDGDELAFTPNYSANLWTTYRFPIGLTIGGGLQYVSSSYLGRPDDAERIIPNGRFGKLPDYIVFNALVQYELSENATIRLNVDNVFDEVYAVSSNWAGSRMMLGSPRTFTISADWKF